MIPNGEKEGWHYLMKGNNIKTTQQYLLFELSSIFYNKKQT